MPGEESGWSISLGSCIAGIPIRLHYTFFLLLAIEIISGLRYNVPQYMALVAVLYGPVLLITIIIHELGHALTTKKLGGECAGIVLWPLGGFALCGPTDGGVSGDLKVAIAGPLTHIPQTAAWVALYAAVNSGDFSNFGRRIYLDELEHGGFRAFMSYLSAQSTIMNLLLMAFNLLVPAYPLDGGRCLAAILVLSGMGVSRAALATSVTGMLLAAGLAGWGIYEFVQDNPTGIFTALVGLFILASSFKLFQLYREGKLNEHPIFGRPCYQSRNQPVTTVPSQGHETV